MRPLVVLIYVHENFLGGWEREGVFSLLYFVGVVGSVFASSSLLLECLFGSQASHVSQSCYIYRVVEAKVCKMRIGVTSQVPPTPSHEEGVCAFTSESVRVRLNDGVQGECDVCVCLCMCRGRHRGRV